MPDISFSIVSILGKPKTKHVKFDPNLEKALRKPAIAEVLPMQRQAPQHLVSPILATLFSATGIREQILRWNRNWLREMDKINADKQPPPAAPIEFFPNGFVQIPLNFSDVNHYLSVFGPPLMLETLYRIKKEYDDLNNRQGKTMFVPLPIVQMVLEILKVISVH